MVVNKHGEEVSQHEEGGHVEGLDVLQLHQHLKKHAANTNRLVEDKGPAFLQSWEQNRVGQFVLQHLDQPL